MNGFIFKGFATAFGLIFLISSSLEAEPKKMDLKARIVELEKGLPGFGEFARKIYGEFSEQIIDQDWSSGTSIWVLSEFLFRAEKFDLVSEAGKNRYLSLARKSVELAKAYPERGPQVSELFYRFSYSLLLDRDGNSERIAGTSMDDYLDLSRLPIALPNLDFTFDQYIELISVRAQLSRAGVVNLGPALETLSAHVVLVLGSHAALRLVETEQLNRLIELFNFEIPSDPKVFNIWYATRRVLIAAYILDFADGQPSLTTSKRLVELLRLPPDLDRPDQRAILMSVYLDLRNGFIARLMLSRSKYLKRIGQFLSGLDPQKENGLWLSTLLNRSRFTESRELRAFFDEAVQVIAQFGEDESNLQRKALAALNLYVLEFLERKQVRRLSAAEFGILMDQPSLLGISWSLIRNYQNSPAEALSPDRYPLDPKKFWGWRFERGLARKMERIARRRIASCASLPELQSILRFGVFPSADMIEMKIRLLKYAVPAFHLFAKSSTDFVGFLSLIPGVDPSAIQRLSAGDRSPSQILEDIQGGKDIFKPERFWPHRERTRQAALEIGKMIISKDELKSRSWCSWLTANVARVMSK